MTASAPPKKIDENDVEQAALEYLRELGWRTARGADVSPGGAGALRERYEDAAHEGVLWDALARLNPALPTDALRDALRRLTRPEGATLEARNRAFHEMLIEGVRVEYRDSNGALRGAAAMAVDFDDPDANDWLAVNQFTVSQNGNARRADLVLFVNGLPLAVAELKSPVSADAGANVRGAWRQLQTYKADVPDLFAANEALIVSDGVEARLGTLTAGWEWFKPWRTIEGDSVAPPETPQLRVLLEGVCERGRFLSLIRNFIVYEDGGGAPSKKMAGYHQFHAVRAAVDETLRAAGIARGGGVSERSQGYSAGREPSGEPGDRRVGVVWHTQGSGKSLTMAFYAGAIIQEPAMENPTVVVLTDRNDLDDQLFGAFSRCRGLLRQPPVQAASRADLRNRLSVQAGGVIFATIQKFFPEGAARAEPLSERRNIAVIADEAHRSQYDFIDGFARHMRDALPGASFIGFTGTPIELEDANTRAVFGDYISVYDIRRAVEDGATVPIYYESRLAKLALDESERPRVDPDFEEAAEGEEIERKERLKTKWAQLEAVAGAPKRLKVVARDIVEHIESRRESTPERCKAMIVCMSRRICVALHDEIAALRPDWRSEDDARGALKTVMTGAASDPPEWQRHIRDKRRREALANRFRDPEDPFDVVIVRDMWLTGFDAPSLHTIYVDKPMRGHSLMQATARVNRVFEGKTGGLVVDYIGLARDLRLAVRRYTQSGGGGKPVIDKEFAVRAALEKHDVCRALFHGFDYSRWAGGSPGERLALLPAAQERVLANQDGKRRLISAARDLTRAFALAAPHPETVRIRDDVGFFQSVAAHLAKRAPGEARAEEDLDRAISEIVSRVIESDGAIDIFAAAGLDKPNVSILSDEFLAEARAMKRENLAVELLRKLLSAEINLHRIESVVQARSFAEMLERTIARYHSQTIETAQAIDELIRLAKAMRESKARAAALGLSADETAFYDALGANESAARELDDDILRSMARELAKIVSVNVPLDWPFRDDASANLRRRVRRVMRRRGYPPDNLKDAADTAIEQAEAISESRLAAPAYA